MSFSPLKPPKRYSWENKCNYLTSSQSSFCRVKAYITQLSSVAQSHPTLCDSLDCSMPGLLVHHQLPEFTLHFRWVNDAIQPSHSLSSPSPVFNLFQHQGLFKWVSSLHQMAKILEFQLQHQSFQWILRTDLSWDGLVGSPCSSRDSQKSLHT